MLHDPDNDTEFFFLRPRDIATYVGSGELDVGITGRDLLLDSGAPAEEILPLGFARLDVPVRGAARARPPTVEDFAGHAGRDVVRRAAREVPRRPRRRRRGRPPRRRGRDRGPPRRRRRDRRRRVDRHDAAAGRARGRRRADPASPRRCWCAGRAPRSAGGRAAGAADAGRDHRPAVRADGLRHPRRAGRAGGRAHPGHRVAHRVAAARQGLGRGAGDGAARATPTGSWTSSGSSARAASSSPTSTPAGCDAVAAPRGRTVFRPRRAPVVVYACAAAILSTMVGLAVVLPSGGEHGWGLPSRLGVVARRRRGWSSCCTGWPRCGSWPTDDGVLVVNVIGRRRLEWAEIVGVRLLARRRLDDARPRGRAVAGRDGRAEVGGAVRAGAGAGVRADGAGAHAGAGSRRSRVDRTLSACGRRKPLSTKGFRGSGCVQGRR